MTPLYEKRVIPTPKYAFRRWLSMAVAVLVLCAMVWGGFSLPPRRDSDAVVIPPSTTGSATETVTLPPTTLTTAGTSTTTLTTPAERFSTTTVGYTNYLPTYPFGTLPTYATTGRVPPFLTTTSTLSAPTTTTAAAPTTTTKKTTTTTKKTTTTTTGPTYPAVWDAQAVYYTEEGEAFEEVKWTYKPYWSDTFSYSPIIALTYNISKTCLYNIPLSECIVVTGFDAPTANGYYRIPPAIDGKVVIGVNMDGNVAGACRFNDPNIAPTVKCITFPTEMLFLSKSTIDQCTNLERLYFDCYQLYMDPKALPQIGDNNTTCSDLLRLYGSPMMLYDYDPNSPWRLRSYCEWSYDKSFGPFSRGNRTRYQNVCHYYTEDLNYFNQLYPYLS